MSFQNKKYKMEFAQVEDAPSLLRIYREHDFKGSISVQFSREPNVFNSLNLEGKEVHIPIMRNLENNEVFAMGACILRDIYYNGQVMRAAYLGSLKVLASYRNYLSYAPQVYQGLYEKTNQQVDIYYSTIISSNHLAIKLLEKKRASMPQYNFINEYTTFILKPKKKSRLDNFQVKEGLSSEFKHFYKKHATCFDFAPVIDELSAFDGNKYFAVYNCDDEIIGIFSLWNQQHYKQYTVSSYNIWFKILRYLPISLFGYPALPKMNEPINYLCIACLYSRNNDPELANVVLKKALEMSNSYAFAMIGLTSSHPFKQIVEKHKHIQYKSRLYQVTFNKEMPKKNGNLQQLEVGLL